MPIVVTKDPATSSLQGATLGTRSQHDKVTRVDVQTCPLPCRAGSWRGEGLAWLRRGSGVRGAHRAPHKLRAVCVAPPVLRWEMVLRGLAFSPGNSAAMAQAGHCFDGSTHHLRFAPLRQVLNARLCDLVPMIWETRLGGDEGGQGAVSPPPPYPQHCTGPSSASAHSQCPCLCVSECACACLNCVV